MDTAPSKQKVQKPGDCNKERKTKQDEPRDTTSRVNKVEKHVRQPRVLDPHPTFSSERERILSREGTGGDADPPPQPRVLDPPPTFSSERGSLVSGTARGGRVEDRALQRDEGAEGGYLKE